MADFPPQLPAFTAGIVLLLNIWGAKRAGGMTDPAREMEDVHKCMAVLQAAEGRYVCDIGHISLPRFIHVFSCVDGTRQVACGALFYHLSLSCFNKEISIGMSSMN